MAIPVKTQKKVKFSIDKISQLTSWQVLHWVLELLDDEVEIVPAVVGEQTRVEGERDLGEVRLGVLPGKVPHIACKYFT